MEKFTIFAQSIDPSQAVNTLSGTLIGAAFIISLGVNWILLNKLLKSKDENASILREVLTAVNNFVEAQRERDRK